MNRIIEGVVFDAERSAYHLMHASLYDCVFAGSADGESALKEARDITLENCSFSLRYPLWHVQNFKMTDSRMDEDTYAPIWYSENGKIVDSDIHGIRAIRECRNITLHNCNIQSSEFGWKCRDIGMEDCGIHGEYLFLDSRDVQLHNVEISGRYAFQYMENLEIRNSSLNTRDAFWHSKNVTVVDSVLRGDYLGWFSENLTLIGCKIIGTQPLCYCKGLKLVDCILEDADLAFAYSEVDAFVLGHVNSIKNPLSGRIVVDSVGEIIRKNAVMDCAGEVIVRG